MDGWVGGWFAHLLVCLLVCLLAHLLICSFAHLLIHRFIELPQFLHPDDVESNGSILIYRSEVLPDNRWAPFEIGVSLFCNNDFSRPIIISVYQYAKNGKHVLQGSTRTNTSDFCKSTNLQLQLCNGASNGSIYVSQAACITQPSFLQFVKSGLDLNFMVAIDFTASNGSYDAVGTLHYYNTESFRRGNLNSYEKAITLVGNVLEYYDTDKKFPTYGFGACIDQSTTTSHCFALNRNEDDPEVDGIRGILDAYHAIIPQIRFKGPTLFSNVLKKAIQCVLLAALTRRNAVDIQEEKSKYLVLLIITDGCIDDFDSTTQLIVDGADYPLSILIVGVGSANFEKMDVLDGNDKRLSYGGKVASRDIVKFVALNAIKDRTPQEIAKTLLEEIPRQVVDYMKANGITPELIADLKSKETASTV
ncbi:uncharacterized protein [Blastocystis hominis]|uniref:Copine C-terminal domain-containing protein n=1 Tax=Blastocystis hominis TaxID=12968 RepID=D8M730_BLAHO|nr:uncharacterized protein [Blastocystis hominis]CBK23869.2 unnamed protein product [Blastocystis hominis]|eukprot:XP_012897917.1 uncharacterized protein [Blastocystis hominis]